MAGRDDDVAFFRAADTHYSAFKSAVMRARPQVQLPGKHGSSAAHEDDSEDDSEVRYTRFLALGTWIKSSEEAEEPGSSREEQHEDSLEFWLRPEHAAAAAAADAPITLDRVRELAQKYRRDELPKFLPYKVVQALVQPLKGRWDAAAQTCLRDVAKELQELTGRLV